MNQPKIVIVGSLNMDLVVTTERMPRTGETVQGQHIRYLPGGKGANQAVGCARLGADAVMIGSVGQDTFGEQIVKQLQQYGVDHRRIAAVKDVPTGTATILHTPEDNCIVIVSGANDHTTEQVVAAHEDAVGEADVVLVQLEVPLGAVHQALRAARSAGILTVLNPAPAKALPEELLQLADMVTPNETEFELLSGATYATEAALLQGMRDWEARYGNTLIVTRGERGVSYLEQGELRTIPAPKDPVVDTTGAGDAFNAALCVELGKKQPLDAAVRLAVAAASLSVTKFGAQAGMPTYEEVMTIQGRA